MKKVRILNSWGEAYLHMKFKILHPTARTASLGLNTVEGLGVHFLLNQFPLAYVKRAAEELAKEGLLDVYYILPGGDTVKEEDVMRRFTMQKIEDGRIFDESSGGTWNTDGIITKYAIPPDRLEGVAEDDEAVTQDTILSRIRRWFSND